VVMVQEGCSFEMLGVVENSKQREKCRDEYTKKGKQVVQKTYDDFLMRLQ
jgi:hypothetical protein